MTRKLTYSEVKRRFEERGFTLLSEHYKSARDFVLYRCPNGHEGKIRAGSFFEGFGCPECAHENKRVDFETVKKEFATKGLTVLDDAYVNAHTRMNIVCSKGHRTKQSRNELTNGHTCKMCSKTWKPTIEYVREQFTSRGFTLKSDTYVNSETKLDFICDKGHETQIDWEHFNRGNGCSVCHSERMRLRGKQHFNWKSDKSYDTRILQREIEGYKEWRTSVYERDDFTCQACGCRGDRLQAHHIEPYSKNEHLRIDINNGITLCEQCHKRFHRIYGRKINTRPQIDEFIKNSKENIERTS